jgi:predicted nuclease with RNAse H fold
MLQALRQSHAGCVSQEIFDTGIKLLPRGSVVNIMRMALRAIAIACMRTFSPDGVKVYNMYAVEKLAHNLLTIERFASR